MAHTQPYPPKLSAADIVQYSELELDKYLKDNGRLVHVKDPTNLPDHFVQRLRARAGASDAAPSHLINLNCVSARLVEDPVYRETSPRSPSLATTIDLNDEGNYRQNYYECLVKETENYHTLMSEGGRPSHPINLGYDIAKSYDIARNLEEYRDILSLWNPHPNPPSDYDWMVFGNQSGRWEEFRESQRRMRTDGPLEAGSCFPARPAKPGCFAAYYERLRNRLVRHGFERPFQLNEDPDRQDKLTTWIEYLGFEYVEYDKSVGVISRQQSRHDQAWKKLVDSKVLRPLETEESLDVWFWLQLKNEKNGAQKAVEAAASTVQSAEKLSLKAQSAGLPGRVPSRMEQKLSAARSKLATATKLLEQTSRRYELIGDFIDQTKSYSIAKDDVARQSILLRWILQQVPLIEPEVNLAKVTKNDSARGNSRH